MSPFAPGGVTDITARLLAPGLQAVLGQNVVVENRTGAGGTVAAEAVTRATDGHTLLLTTGSTQSIAPALFPSLRYDPVRDMLPVSFIARVPHVLMVPPSLGVSDLAELLALLRREPGRHNFASTGAGSIPHLAGEMFRLQTGVEATHVPFRGSAPALTGLMSGRVSYLIDALPPAIGFINEGRLRAVGAGTWGRIPQKPEIATLAEQGLPRFESYTWAALCIAAAGATPAAVARLHAAAVRAARGTEARMTELGYRRHRPPRGLRDARPLAAPATRPSAAGRVRADRGGHGAGWAHDRAAAAPRLPGRGRLARRRSCAARRWPRAVSSPGAWRSS